MKLATIVGARPQFIKAAALSRAIAEDGRIHQTLVHTGQHYDENMSDVFFRELGIPKPEFNLEIGSLPQGAQTGRMLEAIEQVLIKIKPDWVLVFGDTNSTLAGALAAAKLHIPVAHVEAGLRSYNRKMPEEINRVLTDHASTLLFAPTEGAARILSKEGIDSTRVRVSGDVMYDVSLLFSAQAEKDSTILSREKLLPGRYVLATLHRAENTGDPLKLRNLIEGLREVSKKLRVILPLHPGTLKLLRSSGLDSCFSSTLNPIEPVGLLDMMLLEKNAAVIATDSGGIQKEAFFFQVPCVTLRTETEWIELIDSGWNRLSPPTSPSAIAESISNSIGTRGRNSSFYGQGDASKRIVKDLLAWKQ